MTRKTTVLKCKFFDAKRITIAMYFVAVGKNEGFRVISFLIQRNVVIVVLVDILV